MSRLKFLLALAAVALVTAAVPIAQGTSDSVPSRLTAAEKKIAKLQKDVVALRTRVACFDRLVPLSSYGGLETEGFVYRNTAESREFLTSALDVTEQGDEPDVIVAAVNPQCVTQAYARAARTSNRRSAAKLHLVQR